MSEYIREVEKIIDNHHMNHPFFSLNRKTALYHALTAFEDACRLGGITSLTLTGDNLGYYIKIREQLDSLNILVQWIFKNCTHNKEDIFKKVVFPQHYVSAADLLVNHAKQYSPICSAYISYSRGQFTATTNEARKKISFSDNPQKRCIVISDMMEALSRDQKDLHRFHASGTLSEANSALISSIAFENGHISYLTDGVVWDSFYDLAEQQWNNSSELPEEWELDSFSIKEFKTVWTTIATLCFIHMIACLKSGVQGAAVDEAVLVKSFDEFIDFVVNKSNCSRKSVTAILKTLTYNCKLKNNDVVYQPFIPLDDNKLCLSPHLILSSRPERNLISLIHKLRDKSYFELTNLRESMMQSELDVRAKEIPNLVIGKNKALPDPLPDVDYAMWDMLSNTILVCELKWLVEPDSTSEVFARVQDLEHGCSQMSDILDYAENYKEDFLQRVFGQYEEEHLPKIIGCVISKKGIRVDNSDLPVISSEMLMDLLQHRGVQETFNLIESKDFYIPLAQNLNYGLQSVQYAGYTFEIPAIIKDSPTIVGTYKRNGPKTGRNELCPCGSGKKYKKCCGR